MSENGSKDIAPEILLARQQKVIDALIRRADRQNDIGPSAFSAFQSAIALQERVEAQTRDLKRAETELESVRYERERTRRSLVDALSSMADGFVLFLDGKLHVTNEFFLNLLPDKAEEITPGISIGAMFGLISESDKFVSADQSLSDVAGILAAEQANMAIVIELRQDRWFNLNAQHTSKDNLVLLVTEITDLVRRNRDEKESLIDFQKDYLQAVFQSMSSGVCTVTANDQIMMYNRRFHELLGLRHNELVPGLRVDELFDKLYDRRLIDERDLQTLRDWRNALESSEIVRRLARRGGGFVLDIHANRLPDGGYVIELKDVTLEVRNTETLEERVRERTSELTDANNQLRDQYREKARVEEELRQAKENVEAAMSSKTRFLAAASHDLLQPINAAKLMISTLQEATRDHELQSLVERLDGSFSSAEHLLRSLLDISRLESAREDEVTVAPVNLGTIMENVHSDQALIAERKNIRLDMVPTSFSVRSDAVYLLRSLQNLVVNALLYTKPGGRVLIGCRRRGDKVALQVWDNGIGISRRDQKRVFEEFTRGEGAQQGSGLGLGLSVVDRACKLLGHQLELRSWPGVGSVFSIEMPATDEPTIAEAPAGNVHSSARQDLDVIALVVENDEEVLFGTTKWLEQASASVLAARTISEAVEMVADLGMAPDIILADYQLDFGETGIDAIDRVREMTKTNVPAILITANREEDLREIAVQNEISVLTKPAKLSRLRRLIEWKTENTDKSLR